MIPRDLRANVANLDPNSNKHFAALLFCKRCAETGTLFSDNPAFDSNKRVAYFANSDFERLNWFFNLVDHLTRYSVIVDKISENEKALGLCEV